MKNHIRSKHPEVHAELWPVVKPEIKINKITTFLSTESMQQLKVDKEIIAMIARLNLPFTHVEDEYVRKLLVKEHGENYIRRETYYRITGLDNVHNSWLEVIRKELKDQELGISADIWGNPSLNISLLVITCQYISKNFERKHRILAVKAVKGKHTASCITNLFKSSFKVMELKKENIVYLTRDDGSNIKASATQQELNSTQCFPHCVHLIINDGKKGVEQFFKKFS
uniref:Uncharacterized protein n=1 Tax=Panagrolaimus superbus TaxID=310955 RepID=A0A914YP53_9BILA